MNPPTEIQVEVFRAGDYGPKGVYTEDDLDAIAADYSAEHHEAPVTIDHAQSGPAHGWVAGLQRLGDRLVATVAALSPSLAKALRHGAFRKRSVELYRRFGQTGRPYLKALSFLGAAVPEVKGLADPVFNEAAQDIVRFDDENDTPDYATIARRRLTEGNAWRPEWERDGMLDIFTALGGREEAENLLQFLLRHGEPVAFGRTPVEPVSDEARFAEDLVGGSSPDSQRRHRAALDRMNGGLAYRDALILASGD